MNSNVSRTRTPRAAVTQLKIKDEKKNAHGVHRSSTQKDTR